MSLVWTPNLSWGETSRGQRGCRPFKEPAWLLGPALPGDKAGNGPKLRLFFGGGGRYVTAALQENCWSDLGVSPGEEQQQEVCVWWGFAWEGREIHEQPAPKGFFWLFFILNSSYWVLECLEMVVLSPGTAFSSSRAPGWLSATSREMWCKVAQLAV